MRCLCIAATVILSQSCAYAAETASSIGELNGLDQISEANQDAECAPLEVGKSRVVNEPSKNSATRLPRGFKVTRTEDGVYRVELAIAFGKLSPDARWRLRRDSPETWNELGFWGRNFGEDAQNATRRMYAQQANKCLQQYDDRLISPNGDRLQIRISGGTEADAAESRLPTHKVDVVHGNARSNHLAWAANISCAELAHEVVHLMGLCDGYHETERTGTYWELGRMPVTRPLYDCRNLIPEHRLMNQHRIALERTYKIVLCRCKPLGSQLKGSKIQTCMRKPVERLEKTDLSCPEGYALVPRAAGTLSESGLEALMKKVQDDHGFLILSHAQSTPKRPPFSQAEWDVITRPRCFRNPYFRCAQNAYLTSFIEGCRPRPEECKDLK
ncbi:MAG: hypothetical protein AB7G93_12280 [Bdellovibrionales bacterium]